jgi:hypothetical protein
MVRLCVYLDVFDSKPMVVIISNPTKIIKKKIHSKKQKEDKR